jgi:hypothetical protein
MNVFEALVLVALFSLSLALGNYLYKFVGWLSFVPAGLFGLVFLVLLVSHLFRRNAN